MFHHTTIVPAVTEAGTIRALGPPDADAFIAHLERLDAQGRVDRFNGHVDPGFVARYVARTLADARAVVLGCFEDGVLRGVAEMHVGAGMGPADVAFSVETTLRKRGMGTALFVALLAEARGRGVGELRVTCAVRNAAMRALARKFGATFEFDHGEAFGTIKVDAVDVPPLTATMVEDMLTLAGRVYRLAALPWTLAPRMAMAMAKGGADAMAERLKLRE